MLVNLKIVALLLFVLSTVGLPASAEPQVRAHGASGTGKISFQVDVPYEYAKEVFRNQRKFQALVPGMLHWKLLSEDTARCTMEMSDYMSPATYLVKLKYPSEDTVEFQRISGDLDHLKGVWQLSRGDQPGTTIIDYEYYVDTGLMFVPSGIMASEMREHLRTAEERVQERLATSFRKQDNKVISKK